MIRLITLSLVICLLLSCSTPQALTLSVLGTNDMHGQLLANGERGGLVTISGYVHALRERRHKDGGAVLLIDAGDMWQGTLESNISEGAAMVDAYNALGYTAATIGNHEFDFGPRGAAATPSEPGHDARGALKARAADADFPILAANLIDENTGEAVDWDNVEPSTLIDVKGVKVGIVGVMTFAALRRTIALNVRGLRVAPLAPAIEEQATILRAAGAQLVIVAAHAGGECTEFEDPHDLSSCAGAAEIFRVARALPAGLVDHIVAGHQHEGIAHIVNGISITSAYSSARAFSRTDFVLDRKSGAVLERNIFPPHPALKGADYEGQRIRPDPRVVLIANQARQLARKKREAKIGIRLATPFTLDGNPESPLGNLFTDALLASADVDLALHNVAGGLRTDLPAGELLFGDVYELSPFENRLVIVSLSGAELRRVVADEAHRGGRSVGFSGLSVSVSCKDQVMSVSMRLADDREIVDSDEIKVAVNDYIATGGDGILASVMPEGGYPVDGSLPLTRDLFVGWLGERGGTISAGDFLSGETPKWTRPQSLDRNCRLQQPVHRPTLGNTPPMPEPTITSANEITSSRGMGPPP